MTILSDIEIEKLCVPNQDFQLVHDAAARERYLAEFRPMISPFLPELIREVKGDDNDTPRKVISRGTTSYGYDVALSDKEIKLFTNVNSMIIDPKRLDERCLVDGVVHVDFDGAKYVILPPNSYMLGFTEEYFRMPKNVIAVCLGKCLAGNTLISDPETGQIRRMKQTAGQRYVTSLDVSSGVLVSARSENDLIDNGILPMKRLSTRSGHRITATGSHPLRIWNGWKPLEELKVGDRIAVARSEPFVGKTSMRLAEARMLGFMIADGQCFTPGHSPAFSKLDESVREIFMEDAQTLGFVCTTSGAASIRLVNHKGRGGMAEVNRASQWLSGHRLSVKATEKHIPTAIQTADKEAVAAFLSSLFTCDGSFQTRGPERTIAVLEYYTTAELLAEQLRIMLRRMGLFFTLARAVKTFNGKQYPLYIVRTTSPDAIHKFHKEIGMLPASRKYRAMQEWASKQITTLKSNFDTLPPEAWDDIHRIISRLGVTCSSLGLHSNKTQSVPLAPFQQLAQETQDRELTALVMSDVIWDTVVEIQDDFTQTAYDYTVAEHHNFIANGMVVHNSTYARAGAIVNVTPMEPGFEGNIVIEISNSTNLPMKIYANEGISQFLFLRGKKCRKSYADRDGKYQGQTGIQLPFA